MSENKEVKKYYVSVSRVEHYLQQEVEASSLEEALELARNNIDNGDVGVVNGDEYNTQVHNVNNKTIYISKIHDSWNVEDVTLRAIGKDIKLTTEQASQILINIENSLDCNEGINWGVVDWHINRLLDSNF